MFMLNTFGVLYFLFRYKIIKKETSLLIVKVKNSGSNTALMKITDDYTIIDENERQDEIDEIIEGLNKPLLQVADEYSMTNENIPEETDTLKSNEEYLSELLTTKYHLVSNETEKVFNPSICFTLLNNIITNDNISNDEDCKEINDIFSKYTKIKDLSLKKDLKEAVKRCKKEIKIAIDDKEKYEKFLHFKNKIFKAYFFEDLLFNVKNVVMRENVLQSVNGLQSLNQKMTNFVNFIKTYGQMLENHEINNIIEEMRTISKKLIKILKILVNDRHILFVLLDMKPLSKHKKVRRNIFLYSDKYATKIFIESLYRLKILLPNLNVLLAKESLLCKCIDSNEIFMYKRGESKITKMLEYIDKFSFAIYSSFEGPCFLVKRIEFMSVMLLNESNVFKDLPNVNGLSPEYLKYIFSFRADLAAFYNEMFISESSTMASQLICINKVKPILQKLLSSAKFMPKIAPSLRLLKEYLISIENYHLADYVGSMYSYFESEDFCLYLKSIESLSKSIENFLSI
ncbi:hypothetical protein SLOPH_949 [Spraguea lophii 42_110]|uniref:Uncharacterized protein n=1 Tax=Spraguea lophii (strain 42_110) TaxID=1358809 RepID=S7XIV4_SPRLO|nr:hypothetical protein SLOPH_949 [Spraguea lophii 42_110]